MKGVKVKFGHGTLSTNLRARSKGVVMLTIGLDAGPFARAGWLDMSASDARKLASQLRCAADKSEELLQLLKIRWAEEEAKKAKKV
jgi:hypothetical protein